MTWEGFEKQKKAQSNIGHTFTPILPSSLPKTTTIVTRFLQNAKSGYPLQVIVVSHAWGISVRGYPEQFDLSWLDEVVPCNWKGS